VEKEMYGYDVRELKKSLSAVIKLHLDIENYNWLLEKAALVSSEENAQQLNLSFAAISRKTGNKIITLTANRQDQINIILPGFSITNYPLHRLCRTWILLHVKADEQEIFFNNISGLFNNAEMNELADLYASLPVFAYPEMWVKRCAEGIRSNIGIILDAIMYDNPYPSEYLDEAAWNQLVLKAFFTDKDVNRIIGLDERANKNLASTLIDYAHERQAAGRSVNLQLWRLVGKFIDESNFDDIQKLFVSGDTHSKEAAALSCSRSRYEPAQRLLDSVPELKNDILKNKLNWENINS
jgi:muconolactone delta-isomerase